LQQALRLPLLVFGVLPPLSQGAIGGGRRGKNVFAFIVAAAFYLVMTLVLTWGFQRLEQRYAKYDQ